MANMADTTQDKKTTQAIDLSGGPQVVREVTARLRNRLLQVVCGREDEIELILIALLTDGHVLLEDYPGSGKTTLAKTLGESLFEQLRLSDEKQERVVEAARMSVLYGLNNQGLDFGSFRRIQFTPDLLPSDITGVSVMDPRTGQFEVRLGPIFSRVILGDEINRTSPKVQAAMLEAMAERQVTLDNQTFPLDDVFFVIATQNPQDSVGTYPLPVAQLDRFLFKIPMGYVDRESEINVLKKRFERLSPLSDEDYPKVSYTELLEARRVVEKAVTINESVYACLVDIANNLRHHPDVLQGVSTRALVMMSQALKVTALLNERDFVTEDDIAYLLPYIMLHRLKLAPGVRDAMAILQEASEEPLERLGSKH